VTDQTIATIEKNAREVIRVSRGQFNGHDLVSVRIWVPGGGKDGADIPTKSGLAFRVALLDDLIAALQRARDAASGGGGT